MGLSPFPFQPKCLGLFDTAAWERLSPQLKQPYEGRDKISCLCYLFIRRSALSAHSSSTTCRIGPPQSLVSFIPSLGHSSILKACANRS